MVVNVVQVPPSNDNNIWLLGGWSYVADSATHLVSVALVSVLGRGVRNDVWFWMLDQGEQRQQQALLDILPRVGSEVVDIPHDSLMAQTVASLWDQVWTLVDHLLVLRVRRHQLHKRSVGHASSVLRIVVNGIQLRSTRVEESTLRLVQLGQCEIMATSRRQRLIVGEHRVQLLHGCLEIISDESFAWLRLLRPSKVSKVGLRMR